MTSYAVDKYLLEKSLGPVLEILEDLGKVNRLLDVGCGDGEKSHLIKQLGLVEEVYCVDIDENLLLKARKRNLLVYKVDLNKDKLPFPDEFFDVTICLDVVEHIINLDNLFTEIWRVLKPKGVLVISTPNIQWIYHIIRLILGYGPKTSFGNAEYYGTDLYDHGHVHYFTARDLCKLLERYHFKVVMVRGTYNIDRRILGKIMKLASKNSILLRYLCPGIVVKAEKSSKMKGFTSNRNSSIDVLQTKECRRISIYL